MRSLVAVDAPSVWTPHDFPDEASWSFDLSPEDQHAVIAYARGGDRADLGRHFGAAAARWVDLLINGPGFVRLRRFPIDALTEAEIGHAYLGLGALLGQPVGQDRDANLITHIRDERVTSAPGVRKYRTNLRQDFHSDGSDLVGLLCLHPAKTGGRRDHDRVLRLQEKPGERHPDGQGALRLARRRRKDCWIFCRNQRI